MVQELLLLFLLDNDGWYYNMATIINADTSNGLELTSDTSGEIELQSAGVTKAKVTANGLQDANGNPLHGGSYRNLIINGDMNIAQRGTSLTGMTNSGGTSYQTVDRFMFGGSGSPFGTWTQSQDTDVPTGQGFANSFKMQCTTSSTDDGQLLFQQRIEGQNLQYIKKGTSNAESLTLSFWVKSNKTGTYIQSLRIMTILGKFLMLTRLIVQILGKRKLLHLLVIQLVHLIMIMVGV